MKKFGFSFIFLVLLVSVGFLVITNYSYFFSKNIEGEVINVSRVTELSGLIANSKTKDSQIHSYAIAIRNKKDGSIYTASSEDRQWAVVSKGNCVIAKLYPYPPWNFKKAGTFHNARLEQLQDCESGTSTQVNLPNKNIAPVKGSQPLMNGPEPAFSSSVKSLTNMNFKSNNKFALWIQFESKKLAQEIDLWSKNLTAEKRSKLQESLDKLSGLKWQMLEVSKKLDRNENWTANKWDSLKMIDTTRREFDLMQSKPENSY